MDSSVAQAIRDKLIPLAHITTPNCFELQWLTGLEITPSTPISQITDKLPIEMVLATSLPGESGNILRNILMARDKAWRSEVEKQAKAPNGTGDLIAACF